MIRAQPPGMDGIKCPSAIPLGLVLLDIGIQVCIFTDLIEDVIDSCIVFLVLWHMLSDLLHTLLVVNCVLVCGQM